MHWLAVLWAVITGVAAGISADWDNFYASNYGGKKEAAAPPAGAATSTPTGTAPAPETTPATATGPQVNVEVARGEGEFAAGLPYVAGPRMPATPEPARAEGESRRKRRPKPATNPAMNPAEQVCARCKAALEHDLTQTEPGDLAVPQEIEDREPAASATDIGTTPAGEHAAQATTTAESTSGAASPPPARRIPLRERLVTNLGTRGALARLAGSSGDPATGG